MVLEYEPSIIVTTNNERNASRHGVELIRMREHKARMKSKGLDHHDSYKKCEL